MKVYISVDIEGITAVTSWEETELDGLGSEAARLQMTRETLAACQGALDAGADEIYVKDAHDTGLSLDINLLPKEVKLIRKWTGEPCSMLAGLDQSFDALIMIGYHAGAGQSGNPLAHTISNRIIQSIKINGELASEFTLNSLVAAERGVPSIFISGDRTICQSARELIGDITSVAVKDGRGGASIDINPKLAQELIRQGVREAFENIEACRPRLEGDIEVEICYKDQTLVERACYYPGVERKDAYTVSYRASSMEEMMTTRMFIMM